MLGRRREMPGGNPVLPIGEASPRGHQCLSQIAILGEQTPEAVVHSFPLISTTRSQLTEKVGV